MTNLGDAVHEVLGQQFEHALSDDESTLRIGALVIKKFNEPQFWSTLLPVDAMPRSPRGDQRERTVNLLVRDAVPEPAGHDEAELIREPPEEEPGGLWDHPLAADGETRRRLGDVLADHFVIETQGGRFLFPFQTVLPANYKFKGRYKMFNGAILAFLAMPGENGAPFNEPLLDEFYALFNSGDDLSLLEREIVELGRVVATKLGGAAATPLASSAQLLAGLDQSLNSPFLPEVHRLFQRDLRTALGMKTLGRKDRVSAVITVFYLHLALYFWRLGYLLDEQAGVFMQFLAGVATANDVAAASGRSIGSSRFRGQIKFRVAGGPDRPYREADPARASHEDVNEQRLARLPLNLALLELSRRLSGAPSGTTFGDVAMRLNENPPRQLFDAACRAVAVAIAADMPEDARNEIQTFAKGPDPGLMAVREAISKRRRKDFRRSGRDITAQLMKSRGSKGLVASRGSLVFFELGQELLVLLAKLITQTESVRYSEFLDRLDEYGLAPQDREEEERFKEVLLSLQLLEKFSDSGESMYVKPLL